MRKVTVSRMRERYAQTVRTFQITYVERNGSVIDRKEGKKFGLEGRSADVTKNNGRK